MKKVLLVTLLLALCLTVSGCKNKKENLIVNCNGTESKIEIKNNNKFNCHIDGNDYNFKLTKVEKNKITLETGKSGLSQVTDGTINLRNKQTKFILTEEKELEISPQVTDNFELLIIKWEK